MALTKIPSQTVLSDGQFIQVEGPDGLLSGFQYDAQQRALYAKESQILFPSRHGISHIAEDPVPAATCDSPGLLSADDKCKLDALLQTRIGVLGFQGAGFSDDQGFMQGDIILAAGTEFISLERIGNVIRFVCDFGPPLACQCFVPGVRVGMADGTTKPIEEISIGDKVITHAGRVKKVIQTFKNWYDGSIYHWKLDKHSGESFGITGNHPVMAISKSLVKYGGKTYHQRERINGNPDWTLAEHIRPGDYVERRRSHNLNEDVRVIDVLAELGDGFVERNGLVFSVYYQKEGGQPRIDGLARGLSRFIEVDNDFLDLVGYYAAEGCADRKNGVRFSVHTEEMKFGDIGGEIFRILTEKFDLDPKVHERATPNGRDVQVMCVPLVELFSRWFVGKKSKKRFPDWVTKLPRNKQKRIVAATIRGDGYTSFRKNKLSRSENLQITIGLCSRYLIDQLLFMAERCGWEPSNPHPRYNKKNKTVKYNMLISGSNAPDLCDILGLKNKKKKLSRELRLDEKRLHYVREHRTSSYSGYVYNFEVEDDHSYIVDGQVVHNCEECIQIFWVQDESDVSAIRPPTCSGKLPGVNAYGELKIYLFPESTIVDPANPLPTLNKKGNFPSLIFKRYDDTLAPGTGEFEMVLKRNASNLSTTEVGMAFTPGPGGGLGSPELLFFMGLDADGNLLTFEFSEKTEPGLLGSILYKGHLITKQMAVIADYTSTILSTNQYRMRLWSVLDEEPVGDEFTATNIWRYQNPQNSFSDIVNPKALVLDATSADVLPIGLLVDIWAFQIGEVSGEPILRHFFQQPPIPNVFNTWSMVGGVQFGDNVQARGETEPNDGSEDKITAIEVSGIDDFEPTIWGLTGSDTPFFLFDIVSGVGTEGIGAVVNVQHRAQIDTLLPGLKVLEDAGTEPFSQRPVMLWNRIGVANSMLIRAEIGRPQGSEFSPFDVLLHAPVSNYTDQYLRIVDVGEVNGLNFIRVKGAHFRDLPQRGTVRVLTGIGKNKVFNFYNKFMFPGADDDSLVLAAIAEDNTPYPGNVGDIVEFLHREFSAPCVRLEFSVDISGELSLQFKVGVLGMDIPYENDVLDDVDDFVRGLRPGYAVSGVFTQATGWDGTGTQPLVNADGFAILDGGLASDGNEHWNLLEIMLRDGQVWVWWNTLLIPPHSALSSVLPSPVSINTPYFPVVSGRTYGKLGFRMWPGASLRRVELRTQPRQFSEFTYNNGLTIV